MSMQKRKSPIDWPPEQERKIEYIEREDKELDFIIPLEDSREKDEHTI